MTTIDNYLFISQISFISSTRSRRPSPPSELQTPRRRRRWTSLSMRGMRLNPTRMRSPSRQSMGLRLRTLASASGTNSRTRRLRNWQETYVQYPPMPYLGRMWPILLLPLGLVAPSASTWIGSTTTLEMKWFKSSRASAHPAFNRKSIMRKSTRRNTKPNRLATLIGWGRSPPKISLGATWSMSRLSISLIWTPALTSVWWSRNPKFTSGSSRMTSTGSVCGNSRSSFITN